MNFDLNNMLGEVDGEAEKTVPDDCYNHPFWWEHFWIVNMIKISESSWLL